MIQTSEDNDTQSKSELARQSSQVNPALGGAIKAFGKPPIAPKPPLSKLKSHTSNSALSAAAASWVRTVPSPSHNFPNDAPTSATDSGPSVSSRRGGGESSQAPMMDPTPVSIAQRGLGDTRQTSLPPPRRRAADASASESPVTTHGLEVPVKKEVPKPPPPRRSTPRIESDSTKPGREAAASAATLAARTRMVEAVAEPQSYRRAERYQDHSLKLLTPHVTGDSLANAIVGAHLAASRSPSRQPTPMTSTNTSRGRSPHKTGAGNMRNTLRSRDPAGDEGDEADKRFRVRHPNKHHEGDRKRWRDKVSEQEYKWYSGLWAANRGFWLSKPDWMPHPPSNTDPDGTVVDLNEEICDLIVKELWLRSKLPKNLLKDIWDLVDHRRVKRLTRDQFVVGMWLIDRQLEGRKLPTKVSDSVWDSVKMLGGVGVKIRILD